MKSSLLSPGLLCTALALILPAAPARAESANAPVAATAKSAADTDYDSLWAIFQAQPSDPELRQHDPKAAFRWQDEHMRQFVAAGRAFAAKYPHDPRRYDALIQASYTRPWFLTGFKPEFDAAPGEKNLVVDQPALNAFRAAQLQNLATIIEAPDASPRQRGGAMYAYLIDGRADARARGVPYDLAAVGALVDRVMAKMPDERALTVVEQYQQLLEQESPNAVAAFMAKVQAVPSLAAALAEANAKRAAAAAEKARKIAALDALKFTAADGRAVDLARLKGKVVLVDFWATWCGPCKAEIPNVVANYLKYHAKGFEVVGITLENPGFSPHDTAEQKAAKLEKAKRKMLEFTVAHGMPWPQYFDGKWWQNDYAKQFGIEAIPAMFLLDQQGRIVTTEARGPRLEAELKRLLKQ